MHVRKNEIALRPAQIASHKSPLPPITSIHGRERDTRHDSLIRTETTPPDVYVHGTGTVVHITHAKDRKCLSKANDNQRDLVPAWRGTNASIITQDEPTMFMAGS